MFNKNPVVGAVLVFCSLHLGTAAAIGVEVIPDRGVMNVGESVTVDVWINGLGNSMAPSLSVYDIDLLFNQSLFNSGLVAFGDQLAVPVSFGLVSPLPGLVNVSETSFASPADLVMSQPDSFRLFSVNFVATNPGVGVFDLFVWSLGDESGFPLLDFSTNAGTVLVTRPSAVPVPAALWLFGSGLIGLIGAAKRRKVA